MAWPFEAHPTQWGVWGAISGPSQLQMEARGMVLILLWLLGAPLTLILILFLLGIGR